MGTKRDHQRLHQRRRSLCCVFIIVCLQTVVINQQQQQVHALASTGSSSASSSSSSSSLSNCKANLDLLPYSQLKFKHEPLSDILNPRATPQSGGRMLDMRCVPSDPAAEVSWIFNSEWINKDNVGTIFGGRYAPQVLDSQQQLISSPVIRFADGNKVLQIVTPLLPGYRSPQDSAFDWTLLDGVIFQCMITLNNYSIRSKEARINVAAISQSTDRSALQQITIETYTNSQVVIPCRGVKAFPRYETTWYKDNEPAPGNDNELRVQANGDLLITKAKRRHKGIWTCAATNPFLGQTVHLEGQTNLKVKKRKDGEQDRALDMMRWSYRPENITRVPLGSDLNVLCAGNGFPIPTVTWTRLDGKLIGGSRRAAFTSKGSALLAIAGVKPEDATTYVCKISVTTTGGVPQEMISHTKLEIEETTIITSRLTNTCIQDSESLEFECTALGNPLPAIRWYLNGVEFSSSAGQKYDVTSTLVNGSGVATPHQELARGVTSKIVIYSADPERHAGFIQCFANNSFGVDHSEAYVRIESKDHVPLGPPASTSASLVPVSDDDEDDPDEEEDDLEDDLDDYTDEEDDDYPDHHSPRVVHKPTSQYDPKTGLTFSSPTSPSSSLKPSVASRPPTSSNTPVQRPKKRATAPNVYRLTADSVLLQWTLTGNGSLPVSFQKVQYKNVDMKASLWVTLDDELREHVTTFILHGLEPEYHYKFRISLVYQDKTTSESPGTRGFKLERVPVRPTPEDVPNILKMFPINSDSLQVLWDYKPKTPTHLDSDSGFVIFYRTSTSAGPFSPVMVEGGHQRSHIVENLYPDTEYEVKIAALNSAGLGELSNVTRWMTAPSIDQLSGGGPPGGRGVNTLPTDHNHNSISNYPAGNETSSTSVSLYILDNPYYIFAIGFVLIVLMTAGMALLCYYVYRKTRPSTEQVKSKLSDSLSRMPKEKHPKAVHSGNGSAAPGGGTLTKNDHIRPFSSSFSNLTGSNSSNNSRNSDSQNGATTGGANLPTSLSHAASARFLSSTLQSYQEREVADPPINIPLRQVSGKEKEKSPGNDSDNESLPEITAVNRTSIYAAYHSKKDVKLTHALNNLSIPTTRSSGSLLLPNATGGRLINGYSTMNTAAANRCFESSGTAINETVPQTAATLDRSQVKRPPRRIDSQNSANISINGTLTRGQGINGYGGNMQATSNGTLTRGGHGGSSSGQRSLYGSRVTNGGGTLDRQTLMEHNSRLQNTTPMSVTSHSNYSAASSSQHQAAMMMRKSRGDLSSTPSSSIVNGGDYNAMHSSRHYNPYSPNSVYQNHVPPSSTPQFSHSQPNYFNLNPANYPSSASSSQSNAAPPIPSRAHAPHSQNHHPPPARPTPTHHYNPMNNIGGVAAAAETGYGQHQHQHQTSLSRSNNVTQPPDVPTSGTFNSVMMQSSC